MGVHILIRPFSRDLRSPELRARYSDIEQQRADMAIESEWRRRVAENERARLTRKCTSTTEGEVNEFPRSDAA